MILNLPALVRKTFTELSFYERIFLTVIPPLSALLFFAFLARHSQMDDALIYLRYIRNVVEGYGLTYNAGEKFNALTSPLYTVLLVTMSFFLKSLQAATVVLSAGFLFAASILGARLFGRGTLEAVVTASLICSVHYFYQTMGMETTLFLFLAASSLYLYKQNSRWFLVTLALLVITRNEGVFLGLMLGTDYLLRHRALPDIKMLLLAVAIFLAPYVFNFLYYGDFVATTGSAKIGQGKSGLWGESGIFFRTGYFIPAFFSNSIAALITLLILTVYGAWSLRREPLAILTLLFLVLLLAFYAGFNIPAYHWYYGPFFFFALLFACRGFFNLLDRLMAQRPDKYRIGAMLAVSGLALFMASRLISFNEILPQQNYVATGNWLKENTLPEASVAMVEIGLVGWYSERYIIDILGLVNPHNADYVAQREFSSWLMHYQPDYLLRHEPVWPHESSIPPLESAGFYEPVSNFQVPGLVLLRRSYDHSPEDIATHVQELQMRSAILHNLVESADSQSPQLLLEGGDLFAHAPAEVEFDLEVAAEILEVSYGIRPAAHGQHGELCFRISNERNQELMLNDCLLPDTEVEGMRRVREIQFTGMPGDKLKFSITCPQTCDYAWTYWSDLLLRRKHSNSATIGQESGVAIRL